MVASRKSPLTPALSRWEREKGARVRVGSEKTYPYKSHTGGGDSWMGKLREATDRVNAHRVPLASTLFAPCWECEARHSSARGGVMRAVAVERTRRAFGP
jgi:hypothetical protein